MLPAAKIGLLRVINHIPWRGGEGKVDMPRGSPSTWHDHKRGGEEKDRSDLSSPISIRGGGGERGALYLSSPSV